MLLQIGLAVVFAGLTFVMFSKKSLGHLLRDGMYEHRLRTIGFWGLMEDRSMKKINVLKEKINRSGQIAVVTGGARGIGYHVTKTLVGCGMTVIIGVRKVEAGKKVAEDFENMPGKVVVRQLDVASTSSVRQFAQSVSKDYPKIDLLVNNAGVMYGAYKITEDGFENQLATNYLGHFLLTHLLLPNLKAAGEVSDNCSRVVNVSSCAHAGSGIFFDDINFKKEYIGAAAYSQSKLAQIMAGRYMNKHLQNEGAKVRCYAVHPGIVNTDLFENVPMKKQSQWMMDRFFKTPEEGSTSILYACLSPDIEHRGGAYISNCKVATDSTCSRNEELQEQLFRVTCDMLKIKDFYQVQ